MAELTPVQIDIDGADLSPAPADVAGDTFLPGRDVYLLVVNGDASPHTVTTAVPGETRWGQDEPDVSGAVPAGATHAFGPFPHELADPSDGLVHVTYDAVTNVDVKLFRA